MTTMKPKNPANNLLSKFFKVYVPNKSGDDMELPISFNSLLPKSLPRSVTVRSIYGNIWTMALRKCSGDDEKYALVDGWKRIVKDEDLNHGDFLTFEFDGSRCFDFCIYEGRTMCKRLRRGPVQTDEIKTESDTEEESRASDDIIDLGDDEDDDDDFDDADYYYPSGDYVDDKDGDDSSVDAVDVDGDVDDDADASDDDVRKYLDDPENPSFKMILNPKKKSQLRIPSYVIKDYNLNFPESIIVVDPLVKKFGTLMKKVKIQKNGSVFVKGFGSVVRRNNVKTTDRMIFELKKTGGNLVHTIKVYIISG